MSTSRTPHAVAPRPPGTHARDRLVASRRAPARARAHLHVVPDLPEAPADRPAPRLADTLVVAGGATGPRPPRAGVRPPSGRGEAARGRRAEPGGGRPGPVRLTRRGRVVVVAFLSAVLVVSGWFVGRAVAAAAVTHPPASPSVVARHGDTLWAIAVRTRPNEDPRATIHRILEINDLSSPVIQPGQRVVLPRS